MVSMTWCSVAQAQTACDKPHDDFDGLYCLNKVYQQADQDLNADYSKLLGLLNAEGAQLLRTGQLTWIRTRNAECSQHIGTRFLVDLSCATRTTITRNRFLEDRVRECVSSGCRNSRLSGPG
jgi:uncharacterized protein YecT (DUF1311 family)